MSSALVKNSNGDLLFWLRVKIHMMFSFSNIPLAIETNKTTLVTFVVLV